MARSRSGQDLYGNAFRSVLWLIISMLPAPASSVPNTDEHNRERESIGVQVPRRGAKIHNGCDALQGGHVENKLRKLTMRNASDRVKRESAVRGLFADATGGALA